MLTQPRLVIRKAQGEGKWHEGWWILLITSSSAGLMLHSFSKTSSHHDCFPPAIVTPFSVQTSCELWRGLVTAKYSNTKLVAILHNLTSVRHQDPHYTGLRKQWADIRNFELWTVFIFSTKMSPLYKSMCCC